MAEEKWTCIINKDLRPAYYDSFKCLMGDCRMSCCKGGWRITFDKNDYLKLKRNLEAHPELACHAEKAVRRVRDKELDSGYYAEMQLDDKGCCRMLTEDGLCGLQLAVGEEALPEVCRTYPRKKVGRLSGYFEKSLSLGCEAVLHQLWNLPEGVDFCSDPVPKEEWKQWKEASPNYLTPWFQDVRAVCIGLLQDRSIPLNQRIFLMGLRLQALMDENVDISAWLAETEGLLTAKKPFLQGLLDLDDNALCMNMSNNMQLLIGKGERKISDLEKALLLALGAEAENIIQTSCYREMQAEFEKIFGQQGYFFENLAVSIFFCLGYPKVSSPETLWNSYVTFCQIWSVYRFFAVLSVRTQLQGTVPGSREALFQLLVTAGRALLHNTAYTESLTEKLFQNESATLAHMAILLGG